MTVVNVLEINATGSGVQIRFTYPQILLWSGDFFGYDDRIRITDLVDGNSENVALENIKHKLSTIYAWEQRKAFDGIAPVIPDNYS
ncbi:hypothetical protein [Endozoicomonas sp. SCSIO W0465]|uniref:hypothetical protein n=1 Tax=Endozoicomonas sp. SCSIO W0465 TaxID=2918516 RepID=UPI0020763AF8|nr:hypothetical protein [Endozoicomonas sp. SCSIO W0465]USE39146.1 hypothetical protein MJO57_13900 [Endozoicomonas sp. SCSIO W0465]